MTDKTIAPAVVLTIKTTEQNKIDVNQVTIKLKIPVQQVEVKAGTAEPLDIGKILEQQLPKVREVFLQLLRSHAKSITGRPTSTCISVPCIRPCTISSAGQHGSHQILTQY